MIVVVLFHETNIIKFFITMNKKIILLIIGLGTCLFFTFCSEDSIPVKFNRFERYMFTHKDMDSIQNKYPNFFQLFLDKIIQVKDDDDVFTKNGFQSFVATYKDNLYDSVQNVFPSMKSVETTLSSAFARYKKRFPNEKIPLLYTHISGFNKPIISTDNIISVSLDDYLGESSYYDKLGIFKYLRHEMFPRQIALDVMQVLALKKTTSEGATDNLLSLMIYQGKMIYFMKQMFPDYKLAQLMTYTPLQQKWCENNEAMMWQYIIKKKHLFASDYRTMRAYIDKAPFTRGFPQESPARTGVWIGYQIVRKYAEKSGDSLDEILKNVDYKTMLHISSYNPN